MTRAGIRPKYPSTQRIRGPVVEWLVYLTWVWKVAGSNPTLVETVKETHCSHSSEWVPDYLWRRFLAAKGGDLSLSFYAVALVMIGP